MRKKAVLTYDPPDLSLILFGNFSSQRQIFVITAKKSVAFQKVLPFCP